jgi:hypothetical protein
MLMFLRLTSHDGEPVYVNMDLVATITHSAQDTAIHFAVPHDSEVRFVLVKETPDLIYDQWRNVAWKTNG